MGVTEEVLAELRRYLPASAVMSTLASCERAAGVGSGGLQAAHLPKVLSVVARAFDAAGAPQSAATACIAKLRTIAERRPGESDASPMSIPIEQEDDIVLSRSAARELCRKLGFSTVGQTKVATAVSELARNIYQYVGRGAIALRPIEGATPAIEIIASDEGAGIPDVELVLSGRYRSRTGLGAGLRGVKRLMDEFNIVSERGKGTTITIRKRRD